MHQDFMVYFPYDMPSEQANDFTLDAMGERVRFPSLEDWTG